MTIVFNNGREVEINQKIAEILKNKIMEGCQQYQCFSDEDDKLFLVININEISFIN